MPDGPILSEVERDVHLARSAEAVITSCTDPRADLVEWPRLLSTDRLARASSLTRASVRSSRQLRGRVSAGDPQRAAGSIEFEQVGIRFHRGRSPRPWTTPITSEGPPPDRATRTPSGAPQGPVLEASGAPNSCTSSAAADPELARRGALRSHPALDAGSLRLRPAARSLSPRRNRAPLRSRTQPGPGLSAAASSAITCESWPPCQASGELARLLATQLARRGSPPRSARRSRSGCSGSASSRLATTTVAAASSAASSSHASNGARARHGAQRVGDRVGVLVGATAAGAGPVRPCRASARAPAARRRPRRSPRRRPRAARRESASQRVEPALGRRLGVEGGRDDHERRRRARGASSANAHDRVRAHRGAGQHRALDPAVVEHREQVGREVS